MQTVAAGALRGLNDTRADAVRGDLLLGDRLAACYGLGFPLGWGAVGIWIALSFALMIYALLLVWRFHALTWRGYRPEIAAPA